MAGEANETDQRSRYVGLCGLFVFYHRLFKPNMDKKFFTKLFVIHKKVCAALLPDEEGRAGKRAERGPTEPTS